MKVKVEFEIDMPGDVDSALHTGVAMEQIADIFVDFQTYKLMNMIKIETDKNCSEEQKESFKSALRKQVDLSKSIIDSLKFEFK